MSDEITEPTVHLCWNDFAIRGAVHALRMANLDLMADDMERHLKPAIKEPLDFASVVRVETGSMFVRVGAMERHPWVSGECARSWDELDVVEVLRVGIGERPDVLPKDTEDYKFGQSDFKSDVLLKLRWIWEEAITSERKDAYHKAIKLIEGMQP